MPQNSPAAYSLEDLVAHARQRAPFYQRLYVDLQETFALSDLPVIDPDAYWQAHGRDRQEILTETQQDGFVLNSGGTSGVPKFSYVAASEWEASVRLSARSFDEVGLRDGDRVATLFATGSLYASLLFATESLKHIRSRVVQFPLGYAAAFEEAVRIIETFDINVLAGFPTHLLRIIEGLDAGKIAAPRLEHIIYAGEIFTVDQQASLQARFPGLQIHSAGYASVEGGPIGYADAGCVGSEHRVYDGNTLVELLDEETGEVVDAVGRPGRIVFTSLVRRLMPLIRYPTGDLAQWIEPIHAPNRKFSLLGRAGVGVRLATYNVSLAEMTEYLEPLRQSLGIENFQMVAAREDSRDRLTLRLVSRRRGRLPSTADGAEVLSVFHARRPDIPQAVGMGILHPTQVEWIDQDQIIVSTRTGKMLAVIDRRRE